MLPYAGVCDAEPVRTGIAGGYRVACHVVQSCACTCDYCRVLLALCEMPRGVRWHQRPTSVHWLALSGTSVIMPH